MSDHTFEVVVIGLGAIGAATLMHLAKAGVQAIGIDRFSPPHTKGSSHGETRITRLSIGEGAAYIPLVKRSHELWRLIEAEANTEILTISGGLILDGGQGYSSHGVEGFTKRTIELANQFNIPHQVLGVKEVRARFPEFKIEDTALAYFEPGAGIVRPELAIESQLQLAKKAGATIRNNQTVREIQTSAQGTVKIKTDSEVIEAGRCLISAGAWINDFVPEIMRPLFKVFRQVSHWLPISKGSHPLRSSPIFIWCYGRGDDDFLYGFPSLDGETIKVGTETYLEPVSPDTIAREVSEIEQRSFFQEKIVPRMKNITGPPIRSVVCQYTVTPQSQFIIDDHPEVPQVLLASCCSGHGFKHSAALGEALAATLQGKKPIIDLSPFRSLSSLCTVQQD